MYELYQSDRPDGCTIRQIIFLELVGGYGYFNNLQKSDSFDAFAVAEAFASREYLFVTSILRHGLSPGRDSKYCGRGQWLIYRELLGLLWRLLWSRTCPIIDVPYHRVQAFLVRDQSFEPSMYITVHILTVFCTDVLHEFRRVNA